METYLEYIPMKKNLCFQVENKKPQLLKHQYLAVCKLFRSVKTRHSRCLYSMLVIAWLVATAFILTDLLDWRLKPESNHNEDRRARQRTGNFAQSFTLDVQQIPANLEAYKSKFKPKNQTLKFLKGRSLNRALEKDEAKSGDERGSEGGETRGNRASRRLVAAADVVGKENPAGRNGKIRMVHASRQLTAGFSTDAEEPIMMEEPLAKT